MFSKFLEWSCCKEPHTPHMTHFLSVQPLQHFICILMHRQHYQRGKRFCKQIRASFASLETFPLGNILRDEIIGSKDTMYYCPNYQISDTQKIRIIVFPAKAHQHYIWFLVLAFPNVPCITSFLKSNFTEVYLPKFHIAFSYKMKIHSFNCTIK